MKTGQQKGKGLLKTVLIIISFFIINFNYSLAANITPVRTDVAGFSSWTDVNIAGTTYLQMLTSTSSTITPSMDFSTYNSITLDFTARTFGGVNAAKNIITISVSTDGGSTWSVIGTRTPTSTTLTAQTQFSLSYSSATTKIKFQTLGAASSIGSGIDDITISGTAISSSPTISTTGTLSALSTTYGTASSTSSFSVSGSSLTNDILITPPAGFEVSKTVGGASGFASTQTLAQSSGNVTSTTIYVRLTATTSVGTYSGNVVLTSSGATTVNVATASSTVTTKSLTITGLSGSNKTYDGTTSVVMSGTAAYSGLMNSESFTVSDVVTWAFPNVNVGTNKTLTRSGSFTVPSSNYSITQPTLTASITAVALTVSSASANNKIYNGTTTATVTGTLNGIISPDVVTLTGTGTFASANVGTGISVTSTSTLGGANSGNYTLTQPTGLSANITQASQTITFGALASKTTSDAAFTLTGSASSGLTVTYTSSNPLVATVSGNTVTIVGAGSTVITASQSGNSNYSAATNVTQTLIVTQGSAPTDYYRSLNTTGNWNTASAWQSSADNSSWITATLVPTNSANLITIQLGHTITINADATASTLLINGTLSFDGNSSRSFDVSGDISISSTGTFNAPNSAGYAYLTTTGNIVNNNVLDFYTNGSCDVTFNKNGNQTISGTGGTTKFNVMTVDMGTSSANILEIMPTNFSTNTEFLHYSANTANELLNGTIKFSGTYTYSNQIFYTGKSHEILSTCGFWLNNPNVTITASGDSWDVSGCLKITQGTMNIGNSTGNSLRTKGSSARIIIEGGNLNVAGRIAPTSAGANPYTYTQSGGVVLLNIYGSASGSIAAFDMSSNSSTFNMSGGTIIIRNKTSNSKDYYNISGTYNVSGGTIQFGDASTSNSQVFTISSSADMPNVIISNATSQSTKPTVRLASNINIIGSLTIMSGTTLDASFNSGTSNYDIALSGTWSNSGTFTNRSKTVTFSGSTSQDINGSTETNFYNMTVNNSSGVTITQGPLISNLLTFTSGNIIASSISEPIIIETSGSVTGQADTRCVVGYCKKNTNSTSKFTFPVGTSTKYRPASVTPTTASATSWNVKYFNSSYSDLTLLDITSVSNVEYWTIDRSGASPSNSTVELSWDASSNITSLTNLVVAHYNGTDWESAGNSSSSGTTSSGFVSSTSSWSAYSPFTLSVNSSIALPIELISFNAKKHEDNVQIYWETATEINNDYFIVERSFDGVHFSPISRINGAGNSTHIINYSIEDQDYVNGINYYRLTQVDFNGDESISKIVAVDMTKRMGTVIKVINTLGQEVNENYSGIVFDVYSDGTSIRRIQ